MAKWQVQDQAWREGSHGGNEVVMSKRLVWRCSGGDVLLGRCNCAQNSCIILAIVWRSESAFLSYILGIAFWRSKRDNTIFVLKLHSIRLLTIVF